MTDTTTLADLAVAHPAASRVFHSNQLDFCCGGNRPFTDACRERGLDADAILDEIRREEAEAAPPTRWELAPLSALVDHIVTHYHRRLRESLVSLVQMAHRVEARHRERVACPVGLAAFLEQFQREVLNHLEKEETIVFPAIVRRSGARLSSPIYVLELEHQHHGADLQRLRALTDDLTPPADACATWRALYAGLADLERELMEHVHLENNILFRRALAA